MCRKGLASARPEVHSKPSSGPTRGRDPGREALRRASKQSARRTGLGSATVARGVPGLSARATRVGPRLLSAATRPSQALGEAGTRGEQARDWGAEAGRSGAAQWRGGPRFPGRAGSCLRACPVPRGQRRGLRVLCRGHRRAGSRVRAHSQGGAQQERGRGRLGKLKPAPALYDRLVPRATTAAGYPRGLPTHLCGRRPPPVSTAGPRPESITTSRTWRGPSRASRRSTTFATRGARWRGLTRPRAHPRAPPPTRRRKPRRRKGPRETRRSNRRRPHDT